MTPTAMIKLLEGFAEIYEQAATSSAMVGLAGSILRHGKRTIGYTPSECEPSLTEWVKWHKPKPKECYYNSQRIAMNVSGAVYYEGWFCILPWPLPVLHAWVEIDGKLFDVTAEAYYSSLIEDGTIPASFIKQACYLGAAVPFEHVLLCQMETEHYRDVLPFLWVNLGQRKEFLCNLEKSS